MATTLRTDMKYVDPFIQTGYSEKVTQMIELFNGASRGTIAFRSNRKPGDFDYAAFFRNAGGLVSRQDQTSTADVAGIKLTQDQIISVKLNRKIGPVEWVRAAFLKPGLSEDAIRVAAGEQAAADALENMLNTGLLSTRVALVNETSNHYTVPTSGTINTSALVSGLAKMGDRANRVVAFVMHSKQFFDLVQYQINPANNGDMIANATVVQGSPASLGRPIIVTDSPGLVAATDYFCLGLTADGLVIEETEEEFITLQGPITGKEQLLYRMQGEFAYNLGVKGFKWDVANGGANPADAAVGTGTNWDKIVTNAKDLAGVVIQSK